MLDDIRGRCMDYMPVYAECGGLIYLSSGVIDRDGRLSPFVDFFNYRTVMTGRLQRFGYVNIDYDGISVRGHEFHHSKADGADAEALFEYKVLKESTGETWDAV
jgi:cobyrinic acid a,c-diamide synthase